MIELVSIAIGLLGILASVLLWSQKQKDRYHAMTYLAKQFVAAAQEVFADDEIPEDFKAFLRQAAPDIDNRRLARILAERINEGWNKDSADSALSNLPPEQAIKVIKAMIFFIMALSYADPRKGWMLRDFILNNDVDEHAASAGRLIHAVSPNRRSQIVQPA
jgi:hypothetical protein